MGLFSASPLRRAAASAEPTGDPRRPSVAFVRWTKGGPIASGGRTPAHRGRAREGARGTDGRKFRGGTRTDARAWGVPTQMGDLGTIGGIRPPGRAPTGCWTPGQRLGMVRRLYDRLLPVSPRQDPLVAHGSSAGGPRRVVDSRPTVLSASCRNYATWATEGTSASAAPRSSR